MTHLMLQVGGRNYAVGGQGLRIGRASDNHIVLPDTLVSGHHAVVWGQDGGVQVRDLGSTNGTFVNGRRIEGVGALRPGDVLQVGHTRLHAMAGSGGPPAGRRVLWPAVAGGLSLLAIVMLLLILVSRPPAAQSPTTIPAIVTDAATQVTPLERARLATVQVLGDLGWGSGSVVDPRGYILTNAHVVSGEVVLLIAVNTASQGNPPQVAYQAEVVSIDEELDLALLLIVAGDDGGPLASALSLATLPIGDSDQVRLGDEVDILGFPDVGGETLTLSKGTVAGFHSDGRFYRGWIKTDAEISPGNSGGAAIDRAGRLIGIPTSVSIEDETAGRIGVLRPINLAQPLLAEIPP